MSPPSTCCFHLCRMWGSVRISHRSQKCFIITSPLSLLSYVTAALSSQHWSRPQTTRVSKDRVQVWGFWLSGCACTFWVPLVSWWSSGFEEMLSRSVCPLPSPYGLSQGSEQDMLTSRSWPDLEERRKDALYFVSWLNVLIYDEISMGVSIKTRRHCGDNSRVFCWVTSVTNDLIEPPHCLVRE